MRVILVEREYASGRVSFYLHYSRGGRVREQLKDLQILPTDTKEEARETRRLAELIRSQRQVNASYDTNRIYNPSRSKASFFDYVDHYIKDATNVNVNNGMRYQLRRFYLMSKGIKPDVEEEVMEKHLSDIEFQDITESFLKDFKKHLVKNLNGDTPRAYFAAIKQVIKQATREKYLQYNPAQDIVNTTSTDPAVKKDIPDAAELKLLEKTACRNELVKRAMLVTSKTGFGMAELKTITAKNIDVKKMQVTVYRQKNKHRGFMPVTIPITPKTLLLFGDLSEKNKLLFPLPYRKIVNKYIEEWCAAAGIEKYLTSTCFRHAFATRLIEVQTPDRAIADAMGHSSTRMLKRYARTEKLLRSKIKKLG